MIRKLLAAAILLMCVASANAASIVTIDQQNLPIGDFTLAISDLGQSFTPTLMGLDAVEFIAGHSQLTSGLHPLVNETIDIRLGDSFGGPIIATSLPLTGDFPNNSILHFDFASTVALIPGNSYMITTSLTALRFNLADSYSGGSLWIDGSVGSSYSEYDLVFTEGLHHMPIPAAVWLFGSALLGLVGITRVRQRWPD